MLVCTTWKARSLLPDQAKRMMDVWAKTEAKEAENTSSERLCWYLNSDGSGGVTVSKVTDSDAATQLMLETSLALGEFLELDSRIVLDLDTAMPAILSGMAYAQ
jgi:hypothetical protein